MSSPVSLMVSWCPLMFQAFCCSNWSSSLGGQSVGLVGFGLAGFKWTIRHLKKKNSDQPSYETHKLTYCQKWLSSNGGLRPAHTAIPASLFPFVFLLLLMTLQVLTCDSCFTNSSLSLCLIGRGLWTEGDLWKGHISS